jgi:uncharacterized protein
LISRNSLRLALAAACFATVAAAAEVPVPPLKARVTDLTNTLAAGEREALENELSAFEARKGSQVAVLILPSTQPETIEQYAVRVVEVWKLGRRKVDDGVLLLVAKDDRRVRIEVGYGLEGAIPDAAAKRIIEDDITPRFKNGDFYGGVRAGADRIMRTIDGEPLPAPAARMAPRGDPFAWLIPGLIAVMFVSSLLNRLFGRMAGAAATGAIAGAAGWLLFGMLGVGLIIGVVVFVLVLVGALMPASRGGSGGWSSGGLGGGGFSSGGGFSGGGGSSGGGGASGSW